MPCQLRARRRQLLIALVALSGLLVAPAVAAEIFKCATKDGTPLYQNFPCQFDSLGWLPASLPAGKTPSIPYAAGGQKKPKTEPVNVASTVTGDPRIGMSTDEIRALMGEPDEMVSDEPAEGGPISVWRYANGTTLQFDHTHHVSVLQR